MSTFSLKRPDKNLKDIEHQKYVARITKTLYYGKLPKTDRLSLPVTELAAELFSEAHCGKSLERLHLNTASNISRNACVSPCSLILAMLYLDRLKSKNPEYIERTSPSDLFLVSLMISSKYLFDDGEFDEVFIDEWAASGGITVSELAQLEREFLKAIDWEIYVKEIAFWRKLNDLERELARREGTNRGHFTYTEMMNLAAILEIYALIQCALTVTVVLAATYTVGVLTIAGSFYLASNIPGNALQYRNIELNTKIENENYTTNFEISPKMHAKNLEPIHILFLASLNTLMCCNSTVDDVVESDKDVETSWEWWKRPSMIWLSETSKDVYAIGEYIIFKYFIGYFELLALNGKDFEIANNVNMNKATKTRIQDQMEGSWHKEWIDSLEQRIFYTPYPNVKL